jgi:hypothetical protein
MHKGFAGLNPVDHRLIWARTIRYGPMDTIVLLPENWATEYVRVLS